MNKIFYIILILSSLQIKGQNFKSVDTDTLYVIDDFIINSYNSDRERIKKEMKYNSSNNIKKKSIVTKMKSKDGGVKLFKVTYNYDIEGKRINEQVIYNDTTYRVLHYDSLGNCISDTRLDNNKKVISKETRTFDEFGHLIFRSNLHKGNEVIDVTNEQLPKDAIRINVQLGTHQNTYTFNKNGILQEYCYSYKRKPSFYVNKTNNKHYKQTKFQIDSIYETDNGDYQKKQKFIYNNNLLDRIETFEEYERFLTQYSCTYENDELIAIDTTNWLDSGGLIELRIFKYNNGKIAELVDSSLKRPSETYKTLYAYDEFDRLIEKKMIAKYNNKDTAIQTFSVKYDESGNIINQSFRYGSFLDWQKSYTYNEANKITHYSYGRDEPITEIFYNYDYSEILSSKKTITYLCDYCDYYIDDETAERYPIVEMVTYDKYGNELIIQNTLGNNEPVNKTIQVYQDSLLMSRIVYSYGILLYKTLYEYSNGLLIYSNNYEYESRSEETYYDYEFWE